MAGIEERDGQGIAEHCCGLCERDAVFDQIPRCLVRVPLEFHSATLPRYARPDKPEDGLAVLVRTPTAETLPAEVTPAAASMVRWQSAPANRPASEPRQYQHRQQTQA